MTKFNFMDATRKLDEKVQDNEFVKHKIAETLMNIGAKPGGLEEMALQDIASYASGVARAITLDRPPELFNLSSDASKESETTKPWLKWDPVVIFVNKPDHTIEALEGAVAALELTKERFDDDDPVQQEIDFEISVQEKIIETIKEQI